MSELITNPEIPYVGAIPSGKLEPGKLCRIQGVTLPNIDRFNINLQTGPASKPRDDTALHMSIRINQGYIARNSFLKGAWGDEEGTGTLPIGPAQSFEILILTDVRDYKVAVNGEHFCEFAHRIPFENVSHLLIDGDVNITLISWELSIPLIQNQATSDLSSSSRPPQQINSEQYFPPNTYQNQGPYSGPAPYGPNPGAPPQSETGFGSFLEQAQEALVGAIKSGAAEKILGGLLSTGGKQGYTPQNAKYGIYPELPPDNSSTISNSQNLQNRGPLETFLSGLISNTHNDDLTNQIVTQTTPVQPANMGSSNQDHTNINPQTYGQYPTPPPQQSRGPLENLLSGMLSSGTNQPENPQQHTLPQVSQIGGQNSVGGLGSMGGILSNLAGQFLHNPKGN